MLVVIADPPAETGAQLGAGLEGVQVDAFVLQRSPEPLDEDVVHPPAAPVHADLHVGAAQDVGEVGAGELASLIRVEDQGFTEARQRFPQGRNAELRIHRV